MGGNGKGYLIVALAVALMAVGCKEKQEGVPAPTAQGEAAATAPAPAETISFPLKGKAQETLAGGGFSYVRVAAASGEYWIAVPETEVKVGEEVSVADGQMMENFASKSLGRTFPKIVMSTGLTGKTPKMGEAPHGGTATPAMGAAKGTGTGGSSFEAAMQQEVPAGSEVTPGSSKAVVPLAEVKVAKATGANAYTVAEVFAKSAGLAGKKVRVQGQVMKVSANIMGRNWIHLQDGTGDPMKNTHDLVITSAEQPAKGAVVTLEGVLATNKDFGAGYVYAVIVEEGKAQK